MAETKNVTYSSIMKELQSGQYRPVYYLMGEESYYIDKICEPSEDYVVEAYDYANEYLKEHGFIHYEVSNFAKLGKESLHNLTYWRNERYFGVGLSASGYIDNYRYTNTRSLSKYLKGDNEKEIEEVSFQDEMEYQIMLNLRTDEGIDLFQFQDKFGYDLYKENKKVIDEYISSGHLYLESGYLKPTHKGMMILDNIILKLV